MHKQKLDKRPMIFGITLAFMMLIQNLAEGSIAAIQASSLMMLIIGFFIALSYPPTSKVPGVVSALVFVLIFITIAGAFRSAAVVGIGSIIRAFAVASFLMLGLILARRREHFIIENAIPSYVIALTGVLLVVLIDGVRIFTRLSGHLHPNLWGFIVATAVPATLFLRVNAIFKATIIFFQLYLLAFEFQTRGALIWSTVGLLVFGLPHLIRFLRRSRYRHVLIPSVIFVFIGTSFLLLEWSEIIMDQVLQVDSTTRGLESGLSGRTEIWRLFLIKFLEAPLFGAGFDMSRFFAENYFGVYVSGDIASTHNSYLTILFDFGFFGLFFYLVIVVLVFMGIVRSSRYELLGFVFVYSLMGLTESRPLNVGNPAALLFVLLLPYSAASAFKKSIAPRESRKIRSVAVVSHIPQVRR